MESVATPQIQNYHDYRKFLIDFYNYKKQTRKGFSYRQFSQMAGLKSPNYLQLVMHGERNLSEKMAEPVAGAMGLKPMEKRYFTALIRQENAKSDDELAKAKSEGLIALKRLVAKYINRDAEEVFGHWQHLVVRELTALVDFQANGEWISKKLGGLISAEQGEDSLQLLLRSGFIKDSDGKLKPTDPVIDSGNEIFSHARLSQFHLETLKTWAKIIPAQNPKDQELGLLTLSISQEKIPQLQKRIRDFQDEILGWLENEKHPDSVLQVGTYLIPMSRTPR